MTVFSADVWGAMVDACAVHNTVVERSPRYDPSILGVFDFAQTL